MSQVSDNHIGSRLSGRIDTGPAELLRQEVLEPQYRYEFDRLLPHYVAIEQALALEYHRMGLLDVEQTVQITVLLAGSAAGVTAADPAASMVDIAFALEQQVTAGLPAPAPAWHVDRSRNDLQACAQLMFLRSAILDVNDALLELADLVLQRADQGRLAPMPGYTHFQAAQIITPGFHLSALSDQLLHTAERLLTTYDRIDACPLGAGAMAGQELGWDRDRLAALLGFGAVRQHALVAVASRQPALEVTAELSLLGAILSRFVTDLLHWASSDCGFIDLPDELAGISSAMPQKKNFPILERIRGRTAHLAAFHLDGLLAQRNTPFANLVEVSKEAGAHVASALDSTLSTLRLLSTLIANLRFREDRMRQACERDFFGGFTLANLLTLEADVPWRQAQVMAGSYIRATLERGHAPAKLAPELLVELTGESVGVAAAERLLRQAFDVDEALLAKRSVGSVHPDSVAALVSGQRHRLAELSTSAEARRARTAGTQTRLATALMEAQTAIAATSGKA
jgi:argininosuccinate lyase